MTSIVTIQKRLCINPNFLDNKLKYKMFNFVKEITKNECTKDNGYIIEIIKITKMVLVSYCSERQPLCRWVSTVYFNGSQYCSTLQIKTFHMVVRPKAKIPK